MKIKMRDSEIARYKKLKEPSSSTDANTDGISATVPSVTVEETVRTEVELVREELQSEVLRLRVECEELQRRLALSTSASDATITVDGDARSGNGTSLGSLWSEVAEGTFQNNVSDYISSVSTQK